MAAAPHIPSAISRIDRGAEFIGQFPCGDTAWAVVVSPPSGIERDPVYIVSPGGQARPATQADYDRLYGGN